MRLTLHPFFRSYTSFHVRAALNLEGFDHAPYLIIRGVAELCLAMPAFERALPKNQPDAV